MIRDILQKFNIDSYAYVPASCCKEANSRLHSSIPEGANVVFLLFPYYAGNCENRISAYGAVKDYHAFAKEVFDSLCEYISASYPSRWAKGFADHSPFLECDGAAKAGLGIIGENSLLITEKYSSFVFIGELVTTLTADELLSEGISMGDTTVSRCEGCGACKRACPSGCAGTSDRSGCISSITQKKGELSPDETAAIKRGGSIWGCDLCQTACPYTKRAENSGTIYTPIPFFRDSYIDTDPLCAIEKMDDEEFSSYPFAWRKRATVLRNIGIIRGDKND